MASVVKVSKYHREGSAAFNGLMDKNCRPEEICPYDKGVAADKMGRTEWMAGFIEARTNARIGHILAKYA